MPAAARHQVSRGRFEHGLTRIAVDQRTHRHGRGFDAGVGPVVEQRIASLEGGVGALLVGRGRIVDGEEDLDEIEYEGDSFDLGEAIAQTLGLAIDPYREGPDADSARRESGIQSDESIQPSGPLAEALAALKKG